MLYLEVYWVWFQSIVLDLFYIVSESYTTPLSQMYNKIQRIWNPALILKTEHDLGENLTVLYDDYTEHFTVFIYLFCLNIAKLRYLDLKKKSILLCLLLRNCRCSCDKNSDIKFRTVNERIFLSNESYYYVKLHWQ
jgi:hypothetical protein